MSHPITGLATYPVPHEAEQGGVVPRVTLQTIADKVGVSRMTVSNAYSRPDQLSAELRHKILAAAADLGYVGPDPSARALARGTTGAVGVLLTDSVGTAFADPIAAAFFGAVAEELAPTGLTVSLLPGSGPAGVVPARDIPMDGALVYACGGDSAAIDWLVRRRLPLVFVDQAPVPGASSVLLDEREGGRAAAQHLLDLGHTRVGGFTINFLRGLGVVADPHDAGDGFVAHERVLGWLDALDPAGVTPLVVEVRDNAEPHITEGARLLLDRPDRPTGVVCFSDLMAAAVVHVAEELGLSVPEDLSVVGYDDSPLAQRLRPSLTTVHQDFGAKGKAAVAALTAAIDRVRTGADPEPQEIRVPVHLVVRESTAPPTR